MREPVRRLLRYGGQLLGGFRVGHERALAQRRQADIAPYLDLGAPLQVLDLANGRLCPQYILLKAAGQRVYGIDTVNQPQHDWKELVYGLARWIYVRRAGLPATTLGRQTLVCGNVGALPFAADCFDLVTSVAAFEHFLDVPAVVAEVHRVVRPGGLVWACIHLFTSPSGGHNLDRTEVPLRTVPTGVEPWDHLRKRRLPFPVPLNQWRKDQYLEAFARHFQILDAYCSMREGEAFLTPGLQAELSAYTWDELTCGAYVILARKGG